MRATHHRDPHYFQTFLDKFQRRLSRDKELVMLLVQGVDILLAVEPPVHYQAHILQLEEVDVCKQIPYGLDVGNVTCKFPIINWQPGFFPEQQRQIDLGKRIVIFIVPIFHLLQALRIRGYWGRIICQKFFLQPTFTLHSEEFLLGVFVDTCEKLAAPLWWDVLTMRVCVGCWPLRETG